MKFSKYAAITALTLLCMGLSHVCQAQWSAPVYKFSYVSLENGSAQVGRGYIVGGGGGTVVQSFTNLSGSGLEYTVNFTAVYTWQGTGAVQDLILTPIAEVQGAASMAGNNCSAASSTAGGTMPSGELGTSAQGGSYNKKFTFNAYTAVQAATPVTSYTGPIAGFTKSNVQVFGPNPQNSANAQSFVHF